MYLEALLSLGRLHFDAAQYPQAIDAYRQVIARDGYQEAAHRELMRCYVHKGERALALHHYQNLVEWMHDNLGTPPALETTALFERLRHGEGG
jgi:DNA-binding SARP family transcriptional activator